MVKRDAEEATSSSCNHHLSSPYRLRGPHGASSARLPRSFDEAQQLETSPRFLRRPVSSTRLPPCSARRDATSWRPAFDKMYAGGRRVAARGGRDDGHRFYAKSKSPGQRSCAPAEARSAPKVKPHLRRFWIGDVPGLHKLYHPDALRYAKSDKTRSSGRANGALHSCATTCHVVDGAKTKSPGGSAHAFRAIGACARRPCRHVEGQSSPSDGRNLTSATLRQPQLRLHASRLGSTATTSVEEPKSPPPATTRRRLCSTCPGSTEPTAPLARRGRGSHCRAREASDGGAAYSTIEARHAREHSRAGPHCAAVPSSARRSAEKAWLEKSAHVQRLSSPP